MVTSGKVKKRTESQPEVLTKVTTPAELKKIIDKTYFVKLPTYGNVIRIKKIGLLDCIVAGMIPTKQLDEMTKIGASSGFGELKDEDLKDMRNSLEKIAMTAVVEPKLVFTFENPEEEILIESITFEDLLFLFGKVQDPGGDEEYRPFPEKQ